MATWWQNTFDGPDGVTITPANSADHGGPLTLVSAGEGRAVYSAAWSAHGSASARLGVADGSQMGEIQTESEGDRENWSLRLYALIRVGGFLTSRASLGDGAQPLFSLDDSQESYTFAGVSVASDAQNLIERPIRLEISVVDSSITVRAWWNNIDSRDESDLEASTNTVVSGPLDTLYFQGGGFSTPSSYLDEIAVAEGEWIGSATELPETGEAAGEVLVYGYADGEGDGSIGRRGSARGEALVYGYADGTARQADGARGDVVPYGSADGFEGASQATGPPVRDMWLGPPGLLYRMRRRGEWERTPELGVETHTSLHGVVTTSRARQAARVTTLSWERLDRADADAVEELVSAPARTDSTIAVIDPDAVRGNLLAPEHSRGRPGPGQPPVSHEHLYGLAGPGELATGLIRGQRHICVRNPEPGGELAWFHSYNRSLGWPVMPGWPVHLSVVLANNSLANQARLWLRFYDWTGQLISSATGEDGSGMCEANAPEGAVTVSPRMIVNESSSGLRLVGAARLSYAPHVDGYVPLGNGCPVYSIASYSDAPALPWRDITLELQEVRSHAYR